MIRAATQTPHHQLFNTPGDLYAIQTRHCVCNRMRVFKLGRTNNFSKRYCQYPKGSKIIACLPVSHMIDAEKMLLALCRKKFTQRKDFGAEYFEGDIGDIVGAIVNVVAHFPVTQIEIITPYVEVETEVDNVEEEGHVEVEKGVTTYAETIDVTPSVSVAFLPAREVRLNNKVMSQRNQTQGFSVTQDGETLAMEQATAFVKWVRAHTYLPKRIRKGRSIDGNEAAAMHEHKWSRWVESYRAAAKSKTAISLRLRPFAPVVIPYLDAQLGENFWRGA